MVFYFHHFYLLLLAFPFVALPLPVVVVAASPITHITHHSELLALGVACDCWPSSCLHGSMTLWVSVLPWVAWFYLGHMVRLLVL
jgi:hypothetical protein